MADSEAERIGGISVEASISEGRVDAQLNALLAKMESAARQMSAALTITPTIAPAAVSRTGQQQQAQQQRPTVVPPQTAAQASQITFGRRAAAGAREYTSLEKAISDALAKEDASLEQVGDRVTKTARTKQAEFVQDIHASPAAEPLAISVSTTEAKEQLVAFLAEFKAVMAEAQEAAAVKIKVSAPSQAERQAAAPIAPVAATVVRQRMREAAQAERQVAAESRRVAKEEGQRSLTELSYLNQQQETNLLQGGALAPQAGEERRRELARRATQANTAVNARQLAADRAARSAALAEQNRQFAHGNESQIAATQGGGGARGRRGPLVRRTEEDVARREAERIASSEAQTLTAGRTLRTFESGIGGFLGGGKARVEAQAALAAANEKVRISQDRLREPDVLKSRTATKHATEELTAAENERAKALERVQSFTGPTAAIRTFTAIGIATIGFTVALKGVSAVMDAVGPALADFIDMQSGFAAKSTAVTSALAKQTHEQQGNVDAVLAQQSATAGLSATTSDYISTQLKLTTQIKAGALAQQQASDLFRATISNQSQQGLTGGFGGLFGSSLFAQQFGGGKGFSEQLLGDVGALQRGSGAGPDLLGNLEKSLSFLTNPDIRETVTGAAKQQGNPLFDALGTAGRINPVTGPANFTLDLVGGLGDKLFRNGQAPPQQEQGQLPKVSEELTAYINDLNSAGKRGALALGQTSEAAYGLATSQEEIQRAMMAAAQDGDQFGVALARLGVIVRDTSGDVADAAERRRAQEQAAVGRGIPDVATLGRLAQAQERQREREAAASVPALQQQFAYERPAFLANLERQQQFQVNAQIPAQAALQNLASPMLPVGTGQLGANADEQERIEKSTARTQRLQDQLNTYYKQGEQILVDTFQVPQTLVNSIRATGQAIASTQAGIRNEQAAYQVAQYNYQLTIAKRSLADIGGLTGKNFGAGQSYLGQLEKENLALSRQGQLLQFGLQQRQINFQVALAGFQAPGVTPEERQANVKEAEIEASYAQKQLDIQRQMFGNQVQIVDIQNLRQGADLARQIGLLLQGRKVTIDTAAAEERLIRLNALQQKQVAEAGTYVEKVTAVVSRAFGEIQSLETAAGRAMFNASVYAASTFNVYLSSVISGLNSFSQQVGKQVTPVFGSGGLDNNPNTPYASGGVVQGTIGAPQNATLHGGEEVLTFAQRMADWGGGSGGGDVIFNGDIYVRDESDIDLIARKVQTVMGREGALKGLRSVN